MDYSKKSNQYDWFRNKNNNTQKAKTPKEKAKKVWKYVRIFLILAVVVFSLAGCIQSFTLPTSTTVGRGMEFYTSSSNVSPRVTNFEVSLSQLDTYDVYGVGINGTINYEVNDRAEPELLDDLNETIRIQNSEENLDPLDANRGGNEAISLNLLYDSTYSTSAVTYQNGVPLILSSASTLSNPAWNTTWDPQAFPLTLYERDATTDEIVPLSETYYIELPTITNDREQARLDFAVAILNQMLEVEGLKTFLEGSFVETVEDTTQQEVILASRDASLVSTIFSFLGIEQTVDSDNQLTGYTFVADYLPGIGIGSTNYRPIDTWAQAWTYGPFYGFFIYPIAKVTALLSEAFPLMDGWESLLTIIILVLVMRMLVFALSFRSRLQQSKIQDLSAKKAVIDAKYAPYEGNKQMKQRKQQEISALYKKAGVSPTGQLSTLFIQLPVFMSIWRSIGAIPHIKATTWLGINFAATSYQELFSGSLIYLPLLILAAGSSLASNLVPRLLTKRRNSKKLNVHQNEQAKKNNRTQNIIMFVFLFMSLTFSAGIQVYFIISSLWTLAETLGTNKFIYGKKKRNTKAKVIKSLEKSSAV